MVGEFGTAPHRHPGVLAALLSLVPDRCVVVSSVAGSRGRCVVLCGAVS